MKKYENAIRSSYKTIQSDYEPTELNVQFDMSAVIITGSEGKQMIISNDSFELLMAEYIRRQKELKRINK